MCNCGQRPVLKSSKTTENPGHRFWGCAYYDVGKGCNFFAWADVEPQAQEVEVLRLRMRISTLKTKLAYVKIQLLLAVTFGVIGWIVVLILCYRVYSLLDNRGKMKELGGEDIVLLG
ncbi:hypothetical protein PIB30_079626 [Stylosanthes scabra]|uniref:GRF-type domain-containing protein n=1 Tax=Stylosanthes scabra TaxID=79078 RepID=A0ABU6QQV0_9FABA|nr:hypothetical protein [Stylosanthes scabra]